MIRIVGGSLKGRRLEVDPRIRPTTERARKAAFDILGDSVEGTRVLDAAAGSGAFGLEAISRGARRAEFIEPDSSVRKLLRRNIEQLSLGTRAVVHEVTTALFLSRHLASEGYDLVFHDPPYLQAESSSKEVEGLIKLLSPGGTLVHERGDDLVPEAAGRLPFSCRRYGSTRFIFYRK